MKIIILNGSHRKNGATGTILNSMCEKLKNYEDVEVKLYNVSEMTLKYCIGCCKCYETGRCIFDDDIEKLSLEIAKADGIIIGSPTYAGDVSGQVKTIIDRGHFVIEQLLYNKYAISVATYENYGGKDTIKTLNKLLSYSGAKISGTILSKNVFSKNPLDNLKTKEIINKTVKKFYSDISNERTYVFQSLIHYIVFNIGILPFVKRKGEGYFGVLEHWKDRKVKI